MSIAKSAGSLISPWRVSRHIMWRALNILLPPIKLYAQLYLSPQSLTKRSEGCNASQTFDRQNNFCKHLLLAIWISSAPLNVSSYWTKRVSSLSTKKWYFISNSILVKTSWCLANRFCVSSVLIIVALKASQVNKQGIRSFSWKAFRTGEDSGQRARLSGLREVPPNRRTTTLSKVGHHILLSSSQNCVN